MEQIAQLPHFAGIDPQRIAQWLAQTPHRSEQFARGQRIVAQGTAVRSVYLLLEGTTRMEMGEEGREMIIERLAAPTILAPAFLFGQAQHFPVHVMADTDCRLLIVNKEAFFDFMMQEPSAMRRFVADISDRCNFLSRKLRSFALMPLRTRVLEYLADKGGIESVQKAALSLAVQRPSLSRVLSDLVAEGEVVRTETGFRLAR